MLSNSKLSSILGELARNPQATMSQASRAREKKRVRLEPGIGKEQDEEEKSRGRSPAERHKYVRQRSFSEDNMTNQMQEKENVSKRKLKQRSKRQRSPRTPPAGIQLGTKFTAKNKDAIYADY